MDEAFKYADRRQRHRSVRFWPAAEAPDVSEDELMYLLLEVHHLRNWKLRAFACYLVDQSRDKGWTYFFQPSAAKRFRVSVCTIHRWTATLMELGLFAARKTRQELQLTPVWEALLGRSQVESSQPLAQGMQEHDAAPLRVLVQEHVQEHVQEPSLENYELAESLPQKSSSAPDPRTHTCVMQAAASPEPLPRETGVSDTSESDASAFASPAHPEAPPAQPPPGVPSGGPLSAPERPQKPEKHRGESLPDPDLQRRLCALVGGLCAVWVIVRRVPPEDHRLIVQELEHEKPDHAGKYVHSLVRDWTKRRLVALEREEAAARTRAAAEKRARAQTQAEAERARACAQAAQERAAGDNLGAQYFALFKAGLGGVTRPVPRKESS